MHGFAQGRIINCLHDRWLQVPWVISISVFGSQYAFIGVFFGYTVGTFNPESGRRIDAEQHTASTARLRIFVADSGTTATFGTTMYVFYQGIYKMMFLFQHTVGVFCLSLQVAVRRIDRFTQQIAVTGVIKRRIEVKRRILVVLVPEFINLFAVAACQSHPTVSHQCPPDGSHTLRPDRPIVFQHCCRRYGIDGTTAFTMFRACFCLIDLELVA